MLLLVVVGLLAAWAALTTGVQLPFIALVVVAVLLLAWLFA